MRSRSLSATPPASRTRWRPAAPAPATTCSRQHRSATTRTGAALAAIGAADAAFELDQVDVSINGVMVCRRGAIDDPSDAAVLTSPVVTIDVDLTVGTEQVTIWTNDLSLAYVHETSTA